MDFFEAYDYHSQHQYISHWLNVCELTTKRLTDETIPANDIQVRLFDYRFTNLYYFQTKTFNLTISDYKYNIKLNIQSFNQQKLQFLYIECKNMYFPILNYYIHQNTLVLYSIPSVKSLQKAYERKDFISKLFHLTKNISIAKSIIESIKQFPQQS